MSARPDTTMRDDISRSRGSVLHRLLIEVRSLRDDRRAHTRGRDFFGSPLSSLEAVASTGDALEELRVRDRGIARYPLVDLTHPSPCPRLVPDWIAPAATPAGPFAWGPSRWHHPRGVPYPMLVFLETLRTIAAPMLDEDWTDETHARRDAEAMFSPGRLPRGYFFPEADLARDDHSGGTRHRSDNRFRRAVTAAYLWVLLRRLAGTDPDTFERLRRWQQRLRAPRGAGSSSRQPDWTAVAPGNTWSRVIAQATGFFALPQATDLYFGATDDSSGGQDGPMPLSALAGNLELRGRGRRAHGTGDQVPLVPASPVLLPEPLAALLYATPHTPALYPPDRQDRYAPALADSRRFERLRALVAPAPVDAGPGDEDPHAHGDGWVEIDPPPDAKGNSSIPSTRLGEWMSACVFVEGLLADTVRPTDASATHAPQEPTVTLPDPTADSALPDDDSRVRAEQARALALLSRGLTPGVGGSGDRFVRPDAGWATAPARTGEDDREFRFYQDGLAALVREPQVLAALVQPDDGPAPAGAIWIPVHRDLIAVVPRLMVRVFVAEPDPGGGAPRLHAVPADIADRFAHAQGTLYTVDCALDDDLAEDDWRRTGRFDVQARWCLVGSRLAPEALLAVIVCVPRR